MNTRNGSKWIAPITRVRIYARDGWRCAYCGATRGLSLDHLRDRDDNDPRNLVTACLCCNKLRGVLSVHAFQPGAVARVFGCARRTLPAFEHVKPPPHGRHAYKRALRWRASHNARRRDTYRRRLQATFSNWNATRRIET